MVERTKDDIRKQIDLLSQQRDVPKKISKKRVHDLSVAIQSLWWALGNNEWKDYKDLP